MSFIRPKRILHRIIFPFTLLFTLTGIALWLISSYLITHYLDNSLNRQMKKVTNVISNSSYVLNPRILEQLKEIIDGDIILFDQEGEVIRSTITDNDTLDKISKNVPVKLKSGLTTFNMALNDGAYRVAIKQYTLQEYGRVFISLWMQTNDIDELSKNIIIAMGAIIFFGIVAMAVAGFIIARTITAPVEDLVNSATRISEGDFNERVLASSKDEIGVLAETFNRMIDRLQVSEKSLVESEKLATAGRMAAGFAHEIRNPLTSIKMMGQILHGRLKDQPDKQEIIRQFIKEIDRLDRIIQEMINRARPTELNVSDGSLNNQVEEVLMIIYGNLSAQGIEIRSALSENLPEVRMDAEKIKQVLWNLMLNAKDAMPKGGILEITTNLIENKLVEITISDSGQGIQPDNFEKLFRPFFTTKPEGVGLGLTMSQKIIEQHGGRLSLLNRPEGGVVASFCLPISQNRGS